jgi:glycosyltransferase involved in cell wall biosynthesis
MQVVHILAPGPVGGLERVVTTLAAAQRAAGSDVRVIAVLDEGVREPASLLALRDGGVPVEPVALPGRSYRLERRRLGEVLRRLGGTDLVHTPGYRADIQGGAVARRLGLPTVTTVHGFTGGGPKNRLYEWLQRRAFRRFDAVVAVSKPLGEALVSAGVPSGRVHVIPNAAPPPGAALSRVEARLELGLPSDGFAIGWVGRLSLEKGPDVLVEALALLPGDVTAVMIGDGRAGPTLRRLAAERRVGERIRWCGLVSDAGRLFPAFDCFVLSSRTEGTPIVLFEAMATDVPIVATAVGGVPDVVSGRDAVLVRPEDPQALAEAVLNVRNDPAAARARAAGAHQRLVDERGVAPWVVRYEAVYRRLLHANPTLSA